LFSSAVAQSQQRLKAIRFDVIVATFVGICALGVSAYTAHVQRQQVRAMVWPILEYSTSNEPFICLTLANKGVGPAIIQRVKVKVDGQPVSNWHEALQKLLGPGEHHASSSAMVGSVLSPGESVNILVPLGPDGKPLTIPFSSPLADQMNKARFRVSIEICFSSTLGEYWTFRKDQGANNNIVETSSCPAPSAEDFHD
jgi:hypothetical protein